MGLEAGAGRGFCTAARGGGARQAVSRHARPTPAPAPLRQEAPPADASSAGLGLGQDPLWPSRFLPPGLKLLPWFPSSPLRPARPLFPTPLGATGRPPRRAPRLTGKVSWAQGASLSPAAPRSLLFPAATLQDEPRSAYCRSYLSSATLGTPHSRGVGPHRASCVLQAVPSGLGAALGAEQCTIRQQHSPASPPQSRLRPLGTSSLLLTLPLPSPRLLRSLLQPQRLRPGPHARLCPALRFPSPCSGAGLRAHRLLLRKAPCPRPSEAPPSDQTLC